MAGYIVCVVDHRPEGAAPGCVLFESIDLEVARWEFEKGWYHDTYRNCSLELTDTKPKEVDA